MTKVAKPITKASTANNKIEHLVAWAKGKVA
jgi:hypothetical protein